MAKSIYVCQSCGHQSVQWLGKCPSCQQWNSFVEEVTEAGPSPRGALSEERLRKLTRSPEGGVGGRKRGPQKLQDVASGEDSRSPTGIQELDRVLGGGLVDGAYLLLGGDPGIGKSTLLLQALDQISRNKRVLYVTGEESPEQVRLRAQRLGVQGKDLYLEAETQLEKILASVEELKPQVLALDSIQTMFTQEIASAPGSVAQVREVGARLMHVAKRAGIVVVLVGHVTKDGSIAGPRVLEHMVDTVLYFESVGGQSIRILRAVKNRFGSTSEIGVFEMVHHGLQEVKNPSEIFLAERPKGAPGSVVVSTLEGSRPLFVEVQALVSRSTLGTPRRTVLGVDSGRAAILLAVLEKRAGLEIYDKDVFINVVGGMDLKEPACDLGIASAIASSYFNQPVDPRVLMLGEIGLTGEIRSVARLDERLREAAVMGFDQCYVPAKSAAKAKVKGVQVLPVERLQDFLRKLFPL
jgi:DNA repair protein RadA/Sms